LEKAYGVRAIIRFGQKIGRISFTNEQPHINAGEALIGIVNCNTWLVTVDLTEDYEYRSFQRLYSRGYLAAITLYRIKTSDLAKCPDEGRVDIHEFAYDSKLYKELRGISV